MFFRKQKPAGPIDFLIVGLGNPGKEYALTRHNAGCIALEELSRKLGVTPDRLKFKGQCGEATIGDRRVLLLFPLTFMNNSGEAVAEAMRFYKLTPEQLVVISDDVSLDVGVVRIRRKGSDGGQRVCVASYSIWGRKILPASRSAWVKSPTRTTLWQIGCCPASPRRKSRF